MLVRAPPRELPVAVATRADVRPGRAATGAEPVEQVRERLEDERRLFRWWLDAPGAVVLVAADMHPDADEPRNVAIRRRLGVTWTPAPEGTDDDPVSVREAAASWRRQLPTAASRPGAGSPRSRLRALGNDPATWWYQRAWTDTAGRCARRFGSPIRGCRTWTTASCSTCSATSPGSAGWRATRPGWQACTVRSRTSSRAGSARPRMHPRRGRPALAPRGVPLEGRSAAHRKLVDERMFRNWWFEYGEEASLGNEVRFEFDFEGTTIVGAIDRIGPMPEEAHGSPTSRRATPTTHRRPKRACSSASTTRRQGVRRPAAYRPVRQVGFALREGRLEGRPPAGQADVADRRDDEERTRPPCASRSPA